MGLWWRNKVATVASKLNSIKQLYDLAKDVQSLNGSGGESYRDKIKGTIDDKPLEQFEPCIHAAEFECKYMDLSGKCTFESCIFDTSLPPMVSIWFYECIFCGLPCSDIPQQVRMPICHTCLAQIRKISNIPHACVCCGTPVYNNSPMMFTGLCQGCQRTLFAVIRWWTVHPFWVQL